MKDELLRWLTLYAAFGFGLFTLILIVRSYRRVGLPTWPLHSRWIVVLLVGSWAGRIGDLAIARNFGTSLNPTHSIGWWIIMNVSLTWVAIRMLTGKLVIVDKPRASERIDDTRVVVAIEEQ